MSRTYHSNDLYLVQRCWYAELASIKIEIENLLTELSDLMENNADIAFVQKAVNLLNMLVGSNMRFEKLLKELDNEIEVLDKYPTNFPISPSNSSYKKHFQLEMRADEEKQRYYGIKLKVNYTLHQHIGNKVID
jgi:hypothetical protein